MKREIRLEDLVNRPLRAADGRVIGRIREVEAEWRGNQCVVTELHVGRGARRERIAITNVDLSEPRRPRLRA